MKTFTRTPVGRQNLPFALSPAASPSAYSYLTVERRGLVSVVSFNGRAILEENAIRAIGDEIVRIAEKFGTKQLILNFSDVRNLSSYMLATLVSVHKKLTALGGRLEGAQRGLRLADQVFEPPPRGGGSEHADQRRLMGGRVLAGRFADRCRIAFDVE